MKKQDVINQGIKIDEVDLTDNGIYAATYEFYLVDNDVYRIASYNNGFVYNGKNNTSHIVSLNDSAHITFEYLCIECRMSEEGYMKLKNYKK